MGENPSPLGEDFSSILFRQSGFKGSRILGFKGRHNRFFTWPLDPLTPWTLKPSASAEGG
jgi:hypothetical protein